jgi:hypothetical protein
VKRRQRAVACLSPVHLVHAAQPDASGLAPPLALDQVRQLPNLVVVDAVQNLRGTGKRYKNGGTG